MSLRLPFHSKKTFARATTDVFVATFVSLNYLCVPMPVSPRGPTFNLQKCSFAVLELRSQRATRGRLCRRAHVRARESGLT